jgi:predicted transcriptional regulator
MSLSEILRRHGLSHKLAAEQSGVPLATLHDVSRGKRSPRTETVNKILAFVRRYEPRVSYEELFAPELAKARKGAA